MIHMGWWIVQAEQCPLLHVLVAALGDCGRHSAVAASPGVKYVYLQMHASLEADPI